MFGALPCNLEVEEREDISNESFSDNEMPLVEVGEDSARLMKFWLDKAAFNLAFKKEIEDESYLESCCKRCGS